jgi:ribulose kinase
MQCRADVMGKVNCRMKGKATAAFGAAMIAALGSTFNNSIEDVASAMVAVEGTFFPDLEKHVRYSELYQNFCALMEDQGYSVAAKPAM